MKIFFSVIPNVLSCHYIHCLHPLRGLCHVEYDSHWSVNLRQMAFPNTLQPSFLFFFFTYIPEYSNLLWKSAIRDQNSGMFLSTLPHCFQSRHTMPSYTQCFKIPCFFKKAQLLFTVIITNDNCVAVRNGSWIPLPSAVCEESRQCWRYWIWSFTDVQLHCRSLHICINPGCGLWVALQVRLSPTKSCHFLNTI